MNRYRVKVDSYVVVNADSIAYAKANAELALRKAVQAVYESGDLSTANMLASGWQLYSFQAKGKPEKVNDDLV